MPNRIVREGILTSERVNRLDPQAELFYRRLISVVDDYGRFTARPALLRTACYPLKIDTTREADISRWIAICETAGLIVLYECDQKLYLQILQFNQRLRSMKSKYPAPPGSVLSSLSKGSEENFAICQDLADGCQTDDRRTTDIRPPGIKDTSASGSNSDSGKGVQGENPIDRESYLQRVRGVLAEARQIVSHGNQKRGVL